MRRTWPFLVAIAVTVIAIRFNDHIIGKLPGAILTTRSTWPLRRVAGVPFAMSVIAWIVAIGWYLEHGDDE